MKAVRILALALVSVLGAAGCAAQGGPPSNAKVELDKPFQMRIGQTAEVGSEKIVITFKGVTEESRCPSDVQCAWAGRVTAALEVSVAGGGPGGITLALDPGAEDKARAPAAAYQIELREVDPYPISVIPIKAGDYVATIMVSKP
jgi:hypothetical protein